MSNYFGGPPVVKEKPTFPEAKCWKSLEHGPIGSLVGGTLSPAKKRCFLNDLNKGF